MLLPPLKAFFHQLLLISYNADHHIQPFCITARCHAVSLPWALGTTAYMSDLWVQLVAGLKDESVPVLEGQSIGEKEVETKGARPEVRRWCQQKSQKSDDTGNEGLGGAALCNAHI